MAELAGRVRQALSVGRDRGIELEVGFVGQRRRMQDVRRLLRRGVAGRQHRDRERRPPRRHRRRSATSRAGANSTCATAHRTSAPTWCPVNPPRPRSSSASSSTSFGNRRSGEASSPRSSARRIRPGRCGDGFSTLPSRTLLQKPAAHGIAERVRAAQRLEQRDAEAELVRARVGRLAAMLLRRHVERRADEVAGHRDRDAE